MRNSLFYLVSLCTQHSIELLMEEEINCFSNYSAVYGAVSAIYTASALVSLLISLFVTATIILFRKYAVFTQRLALYICVTAVIESVFSATRGSAYFPMNNSYSYGAYCVWSGFIFQQSAWMLLNSITVMVVDLYVRVVHQKYTARYELLYLFIIFVLPLLINWIPFIENSYGQAGPWCWIRAVNNDPNCTRHTVGIIFKICLWYLPLYAINITGIILCSLLVLHFCKKSYTAKFDPNSSKMRKQMLREAIPFLIYPSLFVIGTATSLANAIGSLTLG